jgi:alginate O-acetyltransferase complex protein AlgI
MQIFADFAGYSLMALGLAGLFGYRLPINFNFPYLSASITEFWRRWHISLSNWLRDYLYFPLGGNRKGSLRTYVNLFLVMFIGGLWHGAMMKFAWWGVGHGVLLMIERRLGAATEETSVRNGSLRRWLRIGLTFTLTSLLWLLFKMEGMAQLHVFFDRLWHGSWHLDNARAAFAILLYSLPVVIYHAWGYVSPVWRERTATSHRGRMVVALAYGIMLYFIITNAGPATAFLYFQF